MAFCEFKNVNVVGISAGVPKNVADNLQLSAERGEISPDYTPEAFIELTGVKERRVSEVLCASDLGFAAAEELIAGLKWDKQGIEAVIFVSQSPDYILPATACILQDKLGLSKECYAADVALGCSGWVYGLSYAAALVASGSIKKALLFVGDARKRFVGPRDPLFGSATTVTALEYSEGSEGIKLHLGTDGSGYEAIIVPDGGSRNRFTDKSLELEDVDGKQMCRLAARMNGMDVFSFGITTAPKSVRRLAEHFGFDYLSCDYFVFHQANMKMNNMIVKKLKLDRDKVPSSMYHYGNTNGASIPVTIAAELEGKVEGTDKRIVCCGFGVGLSWGTAVFDCKGLKVLKMVDVDDSEVNYGHKLQSVCA